MNIKLLIAYHKQDILFKDNILTPIHVGRALAKQKKSSNELKWLLNNMIGDDTGDNISLKNSLYNEMTAIYWAWKNYADLGNPDYIGLMHYRRHFIFKQCDAPFYECRDIGDNYFEQIAYSEENIKKILSKNDFVCVAPQKRSSLYEHFKKNHDIKYLDETIKILSEIHPDYKKTAKNYLNGQNAYFFNMFIFNKETFFRYCEWFFSIVEVLEKRLNMEGKRLFVSEWLTGIFITKLLEEKKKACFLPTMMAEGIHEIPLVYATDNSYAIPTVVSIASAFETANDNTIYNIHILVNGKFSIKNKNYFTQLLEKFPKHKITFHNMKDKYNNAKINIAHITTATYYRLQLASLLKNTNKCLYIDGDTIVRKDLSELYRINVDEKYIAGVRAAGYLFPEKKYKATIEELKIPNLDEYVNAGVLLMNLKNIRTDDMENIFNDLISENYTDQDQHILNKACYGKIRILEPRFNAMTKYHLTDPYSYNKFEYLQMAYKENEWNAARYSPTIVHYADKIKPWNNASIELAGLWWKCAAKLPFYDDILIKYKEALPFLWNNPESQKKNNYNSQLNSIKSSWSYRIGRSITFIPRKIRGALRIFKNKGIKGLIKRLLHK